MADRSGSGAARLLATLAAGLLLLSGRAALRAVSSGAALLAAAARGAGAVGDLRGALLGHAFVLELLVLLLVLHVGRLAWHGKLLSRRMRAHQGDSRGLARPNSGR